MAITKGQIAGVVIFYNPAKEVINNIKSYVNYIDHLFIIDNSINTSHDLIDKLLLDYSNISYHPNFRNLGIAKALNQGAELSISVNYDWLLTMDQDSRAVVGMISEMQRCMEELDQNKIGIVAPHQLIKNHEPIVGQSNFQEIETTMTSGNLLNLKAYNKIGGFDEKLFIDYVDHEYCLRLRKNGYKIFQANNAILDHNLGDVKTYNVFGKKVMVTNHSAERRYYITRNRLYVMKKYKKEFPSFYKRQLQFFWQELIKIILFEKYKISKIKNILKGISDIKKHQFGKHGF